MLRLLHGASCRETPPVKGSILYELILLAKSGMQYGESRPRRKHVTMSTAPLLSLLSEKCVEHVRFAHGTLFIEHLLCFGIQPRQKLIGVVLSILFVAHQRLDVHSAAGSGDIPELEAGVESSLNPPEPYSCRSINCMGTFDPSPSMIRSTAEAL